MTGELAGGLALLALIDSTSFGTLLIPLWLMLTPGRMQPRRVLIFLGTVAAFYLVLGLALMAGALTVMDTVQDAVDSRPGQILRLIAGIALMILGLTVEPLTKKGKEARAARRAEKERREGPGRMTRWRERAMTGDEGTGALMGLALTSAAVEAMSMLPYLAAIGLLTTSGLGLPTSSLVLVGYCVVMITPALVLLGIRIALHDRITGLLTRIERWMTKNSRETIAWVLFIVGLYLTGGAIDALGIG